MFKQKDGHPGMGILRGRFAAPRDDVREYWTPNHAAMRTPVASAQAQKLRNA